MVSTTVPVSTKCDVRSSDTRSSDTRRDMRIGCCWSWNPCPGEMGGMDASSAVVPACTLGEGGREGRKEGGREGGKGSESHSFLV